MKVFLRPVLIGLAVLVLSATELRVCGQDATATQESVSPKIRDFLKPTGEMKQFRATFAGPVVPIPAQLDELLRNYLFLHKFTIVRMRLSSDISSRLVNLLVVTDEKSGEVVSYCWPTANWPFPNSFALLLTSYPKVYGTYGVGNLRHELIKLKALAQLLLELNPNEQTGMESRVGEIRFSSIGPRTTIVVEMIHHYVADTGLKVELMEVEVAGHPIYSYGRLTTVRFTKP